MQGDPAVDYCIAQVRDDGSFASGSGDGSGEKWTQDVS